MKTTVEELNKALKEAGLEKATDGIIFPWGFKIVDFEGKKALRAMGPKEYKESVKKETGKTLTDEQLNTPSCVLASGQCYSQGCSQVGGSCSMHYDNFWYCICSY